MGFIPPHQAATIKLGFCKSSSVDCILRSHKKLCSYFEFICITASMCLTMQTCLWHKCCNSIDSCLVWGNCFPGTVQVMVFSFAICVPVKPMNIHSCSFASLKSSVKSMLDEHDVSVQILHRKMKLKIRNCRRCRPRLSAGVKAVSTIVFMKVEMQ